MTDVTVVLTPPPTVTVAAPSIGVIEVGTGVPAPVTVDTAVTAVVEVDRGAPGPRGPAGGLLGLEYAQTTPAATWIIAIPAEFTRRPTISIYDTAGDLVEADVTASATIATITFPIPYAGTAVIT